MKINKFGGADIGNRIPLFTSVKETVSERFVDLLNPPVLQEKSSYCPCGLIKIGFQRYITRHEICRRNCLVLFSFCLCL